MLLEWSFPEQSSHAGGVAWDSFLVMCWTGRFDSAEAIPFIALSSNSQAKDRDRALICGAMDFLTTAARGDELVGAVNRAFGLARVG